MVVIKNHWNSYGGVYVYRNYLEAGDTSIQHTHEVDHQTIILYGRGYAIYGINNDKMALVQAGDLIEIPAGTVHKFQAIENMEFVCLFNEESILKKAEQDNPSKILIPSQ